MAKKMQGKPIWDRVAFLFQGGGALGAFQVGVFDALQQAGYHFDWVSGISIGAINAAIVSGNKPEDRVKKLKEFWQIISSPESLNWWQHLGSEEILRKLYNQWHAHATLLLGQPGFFQPRMISPHFLHQTLPEEISFYDTSMLRTTLEHLIDFDLLNSGKTRLTLSAVRVDNGQEVHFDTKNQKIYPEHIMASGALPPGFPAVKIDGEYYWDGGIVNNTPIEVILNDLPRKNTLCFMVHLFDPDGDLPSNLDQVLLRHKDISYASNYKRVIKSFSEAHEMRHAISALYDMLPDKIKEDPHARQLRALGCKSTMLMVRFHRHHTSTDLSSKDYAFSPAAIREGIEMGYEQATMALKKSPWLKSIPKDVGAVLYDMHLHDESLAHHR
ncbi:patatin-like phospholipase family protein [Legionella sainthelensi]|uniref:Phospholipase n=1 Tax=Legionella sainthelensi TaxID=28087 RepID=A0A2H5FPS3_9GAMM|nr:patatin-like phospholipase family protein [Legionella sainthelensi]AUH73516.1 patatin-like phospholipase family protein [Legionella sainthelensi]